LLKLPDHATGKTAQCPSCKHKMRVPEGDSFEAEAEIVEDDPPQSPRDGDRPRRRRDADDDEDDRPRRRGRRRQRSSTAGFSLVEKIPMDLVLQSNLAIGAALLFDIIGLVLLNTGGKTNSGLLAIAIILFLFGRVLWFWGCAAFMKNKGYNEFVGLIGMLGLLGLFAMVLMPNRS
jgi:hypothetical protein